jgi:hypothetical protein
VQFDNAFDDCQSQTAAGNIAVLATIKAFEDMCQILGLDAWSIIFHPQGYFSRLYLHACVHLPPTRSELNCVIQQISQPQLHPRTVAGYYHTWRRESYLKINPALCGQSLPRRDGCLQDIGSLARFQVELDHTGIHTREIEQVICDPGQASYFNLNFLNELGALLRVLI